jgi:DNA-binding MarR family transcriptional regulator
MSTELESGPGGQNVTPGGAIDVDEPRWESDSLERSIVRSLRRIIRAVGLYSRELLRRRNLTAPQLATLRQLRRNGPLSAGDLARSISVSQATVTGIVDRLEHRELVTRNRDPEDRRRVVIGLTESGAEAVATSPPPLHERFMLRLAERSEEERQEIDRTLRLIVRMMEAEEVEAAPVLAAEPSLHEDPSDERLSDDPLADPGA